MRLSYMDTNLPKLKGEMVYQDPEWFIRYEGYLFQLHPDDVEMILDLGSIFDNIAARILSSPVIEFNIVQHKKLTGIATYAKIAKYEKGEL